jgi:hypothetical protein
MPQSDFFTAVEPVERLVRICNGQKRLIDELAQPASSGAPDNTVAFIGSFVRDAVHFDRFTVTLNGGGDPTPADLKRYRSLGARVDSTDGRYVHLVVPHDAYDRRVLCVDWTAPQLCISVLWTLVAIALVAAAVAL